MTLKKQWNWNLGCSLLFAVVLVSAFLFYFGLKPKSKTPRNYLRGLVSYKFSFLFIIFSF